MQETDVLDMLSLKRRETKSFMISEYVDSLLWRRHVTLAAGCWEEGGDRTTVA